LTFNRRFFVGFVDMTLTTAAYWGAFVLHYDLAWRIELKAWYLDVHFVSPVPVDCKDNNM
jgi:hypothetical protein